ncbi:MAG: capsular biosynthesis protein [Desulfobacteraceae bacterium]|nr:MAG: capsular biosynthesis protein [Desulfobacteraceae bacterium]
MITKEKCIVMDIDGTLCPIKKKEENYADLIPYPDMVRKLVEYKNMGFYIILHTARNMRTYEGNIGQINANTAKFTMEWLDRHCIPYDEIHFGKPWQGKEGFYVDDRTIRPNEFLKLNHKEIMELLSNE